MIPGEIRGDSPDEDVWVANMLKIERADETCDDGDSARLFPGSWRIRRACYQFNVPPPRAAKPVYSYQVPLVCEHDENEAAVTCARCCPSRF